MGNKANISGIGILSIINNLSSMIYILKSKRSSIYILILNFTLLLTHVLYMLLIASKHLSLL